MRRPRRAGANGGRLQRVLRLSSRPRGDSADVARYCARMADEHGSTVFEGKVAVRPVEDDVRLVGEIRSAIGPRPSCDWTRTWAGASRRHERALVRARAVRHRERRGAGRVLLRPGGAARVDADPVLGAHTRRRACGRARRPGHDRHRPRPVRRDRGHAAAHHSLRGGRHRLLVLQRRPGDRDRRVSPPRRGDAVSRPPQPVVAPLDSGRRHRRTARSRRSEGSFPFRQGPGSASISTRRRSHAASSGSPGSGRTTSTEGRRYLDTESDASSRRKRL